jgi:hypothetical protein
MLLQISYNTDIFADKKEVGCRMLSCFEDGREVYCIVHCAYGCRRSTAYRMRGGVYKQRINDKQTSAWVQRAFESVYLIV